MPSQHCMKSEFLCSLCQRKRKFYAPLWQRKESFMPFMANCKWGFYVLYRKVAISNVYKNRFDHSSVYLGKMKLTPFVFIYLLFTISILHRDVQHTKHM